eukprot:8235789-Alexandrium_andersonii.AAC.1
MPCLPQSDLALSLSLSLHTGTRGVCLDPRLGGWGPLRLGLLAAVPPATGRVEDSLPPCLP